MPALHISDKTDTVPGVSFHPGQKSLQSQVQAHLLPNILEVSTRYTSSPPRLLLVYPIL